MRFILERTSDPTVEPVTVAQMIVHLREFADLSEDRQTEISGLITAARQWVEDYTGRALVEQTWKLTIDRRLGNGPQRSIRPIGYPENGYGWYSWDAPADWISGWLLHKSPVVAITEFVSVADDGTETAVDSDDYILQNPDAKWPRVAATSGGSLVGDKFAITFRAGYAPSVGSPDPEPDVTLVPQSFCQAIKLYAGALYDRDEKMMDKLMAAAKSVVEHERVEISLA